MLPDLVPFQPHLRCLSAVPYPIDEITLHVPVVSECRDKRNTIDTLTRSLFFFIRHPEIE